MQESIVASKVKEAFMGDKGLSGVVRKAPLEKVFEIGNVKKVSYITPFIELQHNGIMVFPMQRSVILTVSHM